MSEPAITAGMRDLARSVEPDRYLSALLSPRAVRTDLIVLAAFIAELRRIPQIVTDPHLAEIRLTWWRDALLATNGAASGNPVADAMSDVLARHDLDRDVLATWLDAFAHTFYAAAPQDEAHLDLEWGLIEGTPFLFAAHICGSPRTAELAAMCSTAGQAYGLARLGLDFPRSLARGRVPLPDLAAQTAGVNAVDRITARKHLAALGAPRLAAARTLFPKLDNAARSALLPLALVGPYLRASCNQGHDLTRELAEVGPLTRVWRIWRAHMIGRI